MKSILVLAMLLLSLPAYGSILCPWCKGDPPPEEKPEPPKQEVVEIEQPKICHSAIRLTNNGEGLNVFYVFRHLCGEISQVGIIDEIKKEIINIKDTKKSGGVFQYIDIEGKIKYIDTNFPELSPLEIYRD